jgi:two-component system phosphate regulon response regulator PhoB
VKEARQEPVRSAAGPRVLVVEDDPDIALLLTHNLEVQGYVAESVGRGDQAELRLAASPPDLVILDWTLPGSKSASDCGRAKRRAPCRSSC